MYDAGQLCEFTSPLQSRLVTHARSHISASCLTCAVCAKRLKTRATVRSHLRMHQGEEFMHKVSWGTDISYTRLGLIGTPSIRECKNMLKNLIDSPTYYHHTIDIHSVLMILTHLLFDGNVHHMLTYSVSHAQRCTARGTI